MTKQYKKVRIDTAITQAEIVTMKMAKGMDLRQALYEMRVALTELEEIGY